MTAVLPYDDIVWVCTNLCDLIEYENEALARNETQAVAELAQNKAELAHLYEQAVAPLAERPELADTLDQHQREELLAFGHRLKDLIEENARRLKDQVEACQAVLDIIVTHARGTGQPPVYDRAGSFDQPHAGEHQAVSFNQTY